MLRKPQEESVQQPGNRITLPQESGIRSLAGFKELVAMVESSKGSQIELAWTTKTTGQRFVVDVQWDIGKKDPFWILYEEKEGKSKRLWEQPFDATNLDLCYDILVMTCGGIDSSTKNLSEILKSQPSMDKDEQSKFLQKSSGNSEANNAKSAPMPASEVGTKEPVQPVANEPPAMPNPAQNPNFVPGYMYPPGMGMPMNPGIGYPMPGYNMPPIMPMPPNIPMPAPVNYPNTVNTGYPGGSASNAWTDGVNTNTYGQPIAVDPALNRLPLDSNLLNKRNDDSLIDLLVRAELITQPSLDAALKLQDLLQLGRINTQKAAEVLKLHHNKGQNIENYINAPASAPIQPKSAVPNKETVAPLELLVKAGLISQDDIKTAQGISTKHGGDLTSILLAAQKIDEQTLEAAKICYSLQNDQLIKVEQSVMVLNYCSRSRVNFDEAMSELNWDNPRKQK
jgi:hypothetical protein